MVKTTNSQIISGGGQLLGRLGNLPNSWQERSAAINGRRILACVCAVSGNLSNNWKKCCPAAVLRHILSGLRFPTTRERIVHIGSAFECVDFAIRKAVAA